MTKDRARAGAPGWLIQAWIPENRRQNLLVAIAAMLTLMLASFPVFP